MPEITELRPGSQAGEKRQEKVSSSSGETAVGFPIKRIVGLNDMLNQFLTQDQEQVVRSAFFTTITICSVCGVAVSLASVFLLLQPFLRPLLWSLLFGSFLFPFKLRMTRFMRHFIHRTNREEKMLTLESVCLPIRLVFWSMDSLIGVMWDYAKLLTTIFLTLTTTHLMSRYLSATHSFIQVIGSSASCVVSLFHALQSSDHSLLIFTVSLAHLILISFFWDNELVRKSAKIMSPIVWMAIICQIIGFTGTFGLMIAFIGACLMVMGLFSRLISDSVDGESVAEESIITSIIKTISSSIWSFLKSLLPLNKLQNYYKPSVKEKDSSADEQEEEEEADDVVDSTSDPSQEKTPLSSLYIYSLMWSCCLAYVWMSPAILVLMPIPIAVSVIRFLSSRFSPRILNHYLVTDTIIPWFEFRKSGLLPPSILTMGRVLVTGDRLLVKLLSQYVDTICSLTVILLVMLVLTMAAAVLVFQVYVESIHLLHVMGDIVDSAITSHPEIRTWIEGLIPGNNTSNGTISTINNTLFDQLAENAYSYGRKYLKHSIRSVLSDASSNDNETIASIERQLLHVWDRSYDSWITSSSLVATKDKDIVEDWQQQLLNAFQSLDVSLCVRVLRSNVETVLSILESVWSLVGNNISLFFSGMSAVLSLLMSGSSALLNALLNSIVFMTSLFYLLSASDQQYMPVVWLMRVMPDSSAGEGVRQRRVRHRRNRQDNRFVRALDEGINCVFRTSFKIACFYGLYTWLIHTLFQSRLVFMPSVVSALLAVVPIVGSYWASVPAVLELLLVHGLQGRALLMFSCSVLPVYVVDSSFYSEFTRSSGHPYLTGLAIAGGLFFLGIEGAIAGPILLSCFFAAGNFYQDIMSEGQGRGLRAGQSTGSRRRESSLI